MGRKSQAMERRALILAAFVRCIAQHGIDVPLEKIADEAGVQRSLIRHYLGNRDELVAELITRIAEEYPVKVAAALEVAVTHGAAGIVEVFLPEAPDELEWDAVILAVVNTTQGRYAEAKQQIAAMLQHLIALTATALASLYPAAPLAACQQVAYALLCLSQSNDSFRWLGLDSTYTTAARISAGHLLATLG